MNHFKTKQNKLEKLRSIFFLIGLIVATGFTFLAFEWISPVYISTLPNPIVTVEDPWDIPRIYPEEEKKVEKPKVKKDEPKPNPDKIEIIKNDVKKIVKKEEIETKDNKFNPDDWTTPTTDPKPVEKIFALPSVMPHFNQCASLPENERKLCTQKLMFKHFGKTIKVPESVKILGTGTYKAFVYFEVNKKGEIENITIMNDEKHKIPKELARQAYNAVNTLPKMNPGKNHGKVVRVKYSMPIVFDVI